MSIEKYNQRVAWLCTQVRMRGRFKVPLEQVARAARYVLGPAPSEQERWPINADKIVEWMAKWELKCARRWKMNSRRQLVPR